MAVTLHQQGCPRTAIESIKLLRNKVRDIMVPRTRKAGRISQKYKESIKKNVSNQVKEVSDLNPTFKFLKKCNSYPKRNWHKD